MKKAAVFAAFLIFDLIPVNTHPSKRTDSFAFNPVPFACPYGKSIMGM